MPKGYTEHALYVQNTEIKPEAPTLQKSTALFDSEWLTLPQIVASSHSSSVFRPSPLICQTWGERAWL